VIYYHFKNVIIEAFISGWGWFVTDKKKISLTIHKIPLFSTLPCLFVITLKLILHGGVKQKEINVGKFILAVWL